MDTINPTRRAAAARVRAEGPMPLTEACAYVPARNRQGHASAATLLRWIIAGELDGARVNGTWHTSEPAIERYLAERD